MSRAVQKAAKGFSLIELMCVMAIIAILASMMLPAMSKALRRARGLTSHLGGSNWIEMRIDEVVTNYTRYRLAHPNHGKLMNKKAFVRELQLSPKAEAWFVLTSVEYRPFSAADPGDQTAIVVYPSDGSGTGQRIIVFRIADLLIP